MARQTHSVVWRNHFRRLVALLLAGASGRLGADGFASCPECVSVFYGGLGGSECYRIPSIIRTHTGVLLAFVENRPECGDDTPHTIVLRRSSDNGETWGPVIEVATNLRMPLPNSVSSLSNPNPLEVDFKNGTYAILVMYDTMNNPDRDKHGADMQIWSHDEGETWGEPRVMCFPPQPNIGGLIGPATGIQSQKGTLIFNAGFPECCRFLFWSHDFGLHWESSSQMPGEIDGEGSIAFLNNHADENDETVIINMRQDGKNHRLQRTWTFTSPHDGSWSDYVWPDGLVDGDVQGSLINHQGTLYLSNIALDHTERTHLTLKRSSDKGVSWEKVMLVWEGPSAYSQLVSIDENTLGILFEGGTETPYETVWFTQIPLGGAIYT